MKPVIFDVEAPDGHQVTKQTALCYEVSLSTHKPDEKWRRNHRVMVVCQSAQAAIEIVASHYPDDPQIDQIILRNRSMAVIIAGSLLEGTS